MGMQAMTAADQLTTNDSTVAVVPVLEPLEGGDAIGERVQTALLNASSPREVTERRRERRHPFPYPVAVLPVGANRRLQRDETFFVIGKHLSFGGLDFYHHQAVPHRHAVVTLPCGLAGPVALLIDLAWCRFGAHRWYENGGKFIHATRVPDDHLDIDDLDLLLI